MRGRFIETPGHRGRFRATPGITRTGPSPSWGWGLWAAALLGCAAVGLRELIASGPWLTLLLVLIVAMSLLGIVLRLALRRTPRPVQTAMVAGVVAAFMAGATVKAAAADAMARGFWPTREALHQTGTVLSDALSALSYEVPPTADLATFVPLAYAGFGLVITLVVAAAVVWRAAPVMVLGGLLPWAFVLTMRWDAGVTWPLASAGVVALFGLWLGLTKPRGSAMMTGTRATVGVAVIVWALVAATFAVAAAPGVRGWGRGDAWMQSLGNGGGNARPDAVVQGISVGGSLDVRAMLLQPDPTPRIHVEGDYDGPFVVDTMTVFDGTTWTPDVSINQYGVGVGDDLVHPQNDSLFLKSTSTTLRFDAWTNAAIPLPTGPSQLAQWLTPAPDTALKIGVFDADATTLRLQRPSVAGETVSFSTRELDRSQLDGYSTGAPASSLDTAGLWAVPSTPHTADLQALATRLTIGATTDYGKLLAIQSYLRSPAFSYTLTPPPSRSGDALWDFLQNKTGYCVQFTTAMVVLGRLAGLPMRAAVGFAPPPGGTGDIGDSSAHMWPQAYFVNVGWVDFEPTAAVTGALPTTSPTTTTPTPGQTTSGTATNTPGKTPSPVDSTRTGSPSPTDVPAGAFPWDVVLAGLGVVVAVALVLTGRRIHLRRWTPERAWAAIARAARKRRLLTDGATPRATAAALRPLLDDDANRLLRDLANEIERTRYSLDAPPVTPGRHWHDVQSRVLAAMRRGRRGA